MAARVTAAAVYRATTLASRVRPQVRGPREATTTDAERRVAAIPAADVAGNARLMDVYEEATLRPPTWRLIAVLNLPRRLLPPPQ
jgi:hypothetical protein